MKFLTNMPSTMSAQSAMQYERRPDNLTKWGAFKKYMYNKETKTCCNRTALNWFILLIFFLLFAIFIIGVFAAFLYTIVYLIKANFKESSWFHKSDLMDFSHPGISFVPNLGETPVSLIWYTFRGKQADDNMKPEAYIKYIEEHLEEYDDAEKKSKKRNTVYAHCNYTYKPAKKLCLFKRELLGVCSNGTYGYIEKQPCIFIKLNKVPYWKPKAYRLRDIPKEVPVALRNASRQMGERENIWVYCTGNRPMDTENLGAISYYPYNGFPNYFYPFVVHPLYLQPLVAVKLEGILEGYVVTVTCRIYAKNIPMDSRSRSVEISVYIEK